MNEVGGGLKKTKCYVQLSVVILYMENAIVNDNKAMDSSFGKLINCPKSLQKLQKTIMFENPIIVSSAMTLSRLKILHPIEVKLGDNKW